MPIITEQMVNTNVGVGAVAQPNVSTGRAMQNLGGVVSDIMLDVTQKRTEAETENALGKFRIGLNDNSNLQIENIKSDSKLNWSINGDEIKDTIKKDIMAFSESAAQGAPNDIARDKIRQTAQGFLPSIADRLEVIHADKVFSEHEKLSREIIGKATGSLPYEAGAQQADVIYKQNAITLMGMRKTPYANPEKLNARDADYTSQFSEKFAANGILNNPLKTLITFAPDIGMYIQNKKVSGNLRNADVNPMANIAYKSSDGNFYMTKFDPRTQSFTAVKTEIDLDEETKKNAAFVDVTTKEVIVSNKTLLAAKDTPQFVKDLYNRNPEKASAIVQKLLIETLQKRQTDASLQNRMIKDVSDKAFTGKVTQAEASNNFMLAADENTMNSLTMKSEKLDNLERGITPAIVAGAVGQLKENPVMGDTEFKQVTDSIDGRVDALIGSTNPLMERMLTDLGDGDYEQGKEIAKTYISGNKDKIAKKLDESRENFRKEFAADGAAYMRSNTLSAEQKDTIDSFWRKGVYEAQHDPRTEAMLTKTFDPMLAKIHRIGYHTGTSSIGATKAEEANLAEYLKSNTTNPEAQDNVIGNLNKYAGPKATADFLDRNGLTGLRSFSLIDSNQPLRIQIAQADRSFKNNVEQLKVRGEDILTIDSETYSAVNSSDIVRVLSVGGNVNRQANAASVTANIKALVYHNMVNGNLSASDARKKAIKDYSDSFDFIADDGPNGNFYLFASKGKMGSKENITEWLQTRGTAADFLAKKGLVIPETFRAQHKGLYNEQQIRENFINQVSKNLVWTTNADGNGARLMMRDKGNNLIPLFVESSKTGVQSDLEVTYKEINERAIMNRNRGSNVAPSDIDNPNIPQSTYMSPLRKQVMNSKLKSESAGYQGLAPDMNVETSAAATMVDPQWLEETFAVEGELASKGFTFDRIYVEDSPKNLLHSTMIMNLDTLNTPANQAIVGETPIFRHKTGNGKTVVSYLPLPPDKFLALSDADKKKYFPVIEEAARKTMKNFTRVSTNPEVASFMKGNTLTQEQFWGIADIWHVYGGSQLQGTAGDKQRPERAELGKLLKTKQFDKALEYMASNPNNAFDDMKNVARMRRLERYFGGNRA